MGLLNVRAGLTYNLLVFSTNCVDLFYNFVQTGLAFSDLDAREFPSPGAYERRQLGIPRPGSTRAVGLGIPTPMESRVRNPAPSLTLIPSGLSIRDRRCIDASGAEIPEL